MLLLLELRAAVTMLPLLRLELELDDHFISAAVPKCRSVTRIFFCFLFFGLFTEFMSIRCTVLLALQQSHRTNTHERLLGFERLHGMA